MANVVEQRPEEDERPRAGAGAGDEDLVPRREVALHVSFQFRADRGADDAVEGEERAETFQVGVPENAAHDPGDDGQELEHGIVHPGVVRDFLGIDESELLACFLCF